MGTEDVGLCILQTVLQAPVLSVCSATFLYRAGCTDRQLHLGNSTEINPGKRPIVTAHNILNSCQIFSISRRIHKLLPLNISFPQQLHFDLISHIICMYPYKRFSTCKESCARRHSTHKSTCRVADQRPISSNCVSN